MCYKIEPRGGTGTGDDCNRVTCAQRILITFDRRRTSYVSNASLNPCSVNIDAFEE
jgi:hypothetical protein